jgi:DNA repair photolyase
VVNDVAGVAADSTHFERELDAVVADLLGPLLALQERPSKTGFRLIGWDGEHGVSLTLARGDALVLVELEARDDARPCYARTARFNVHARRPLRAGAPLSPLERRAVDQVVEIVRGREGRLPVVELPTTKRRSLVREIEVSRVLVAEAPGQYYLNPYAGCVIGCAFCYVAERADLSRRLEGQPILPWGRWVDVKTNAAAILREEVKRAPPGIVRLSPIVTDPYQPIERRFRVTRQCLEVLLEAGFIPVILTRAARVQDDLDVLRRFPVAAVGLSIPTDDDGVRRAFERGADPIEERFEALRACHAAGLYTFGVVQPMLPMNAARLVERMAPLVRAVRIDRMHALDRTGPLYQEAGFPEAATEAFFERTAAELERGFAAHGVRVHELDDLAAVLGAVAPRPR